MFSGLVFTVGQQAKRKHRATWRRSMFSGGEKKLSFVFNFGFLIGKHTSATLARKLFVVPVLGYLYAVEG